MLCWAWVQKPGHGWDFLGTVHTTPAFFSVALYTPQGQRRAVAMKPHTGSCLSGHFKTQCQTKQAGGGGRAGQQGQGSIAWSEKTAGCLCRRLRSLDYFDGVPTLIGGRFLGTRDSVTDSELRKLPGGVLFEPDTLVDGNDGGIPNKGEKKEFWNILNSGQTNRHQT